MRTTISRYLRRSFMKAMRSVPSLERERAIKILNLYEYLVFLERYILDYELRDVGSLSDYFTLRDFSESANPFIDKQTILRDIRRVEEALSQEKGLKEIRRSVSYKRLIQSFSLYLQDILGDLEIPYSSEIRTYNQTKYRYFAPSEWVGLAEIPTKVRLSLSKGLLEHTKSKRSEELRVEDTLLVLKNTRLPDMDLLNDSWTEKEKESMRLSGFLTRGEGEEPIKKEDFRVYDENHKFFQYFIEHLPREIQDSTAKIDDLEFYFPSPSRAEPTTLERRVFRNSEGEAIYVYNFLFEKGTCVGAGFGSQVVFGQIISALKTPSMRGLSLLAAEDEDFVGSKVWPKFGYDGQVDISDLNPFSDDMEDYLHRIRRAHADKINVSTILSAVDGAGNNIGVSWWSRNSVEFEAHFDLSPKSLSMRVFTSYFRKKLSQFDMNAEEFLSMDLPIDLSDFFCLLEAIKKVTSMRGLRAIMPDILSTFDSSSAEEKDYFLREIEDDHPLLADILKSKRGSSQYTDPTAESVWAEIGQEMIRDSDAQRARELLVGGQS